MPSIRIGLFDDHDIVRAGFRQILGRHDDIEIVCEGATGRQAIASVRAHLLDVAVVDLSPPDLSGIDVLKQVKGNRPETAILIVSAFSEEHYGMSVLKAGASGFVSKALVPETLVCAVRTVAAGRRYVSPRLVEMLVLGLTKGIQRSVHSRLTDREFQIFTKLATGRGVAEIAADLLLSAKTVGTYRTRLLEKMGMRTNADLTRYAIHNELMPR